MKIIVDAFGGDNAPVEILKGCALAVKELGVEIILTGDEQKIKEAAAQNSISLEKMEIVHASQVISIHDEPTALLKAFSDSSMAVGCKLLSEGRGDAFVSAGSTGALVVGATLIVKRIKGIKRVAISTVIPCKDGCYLLTDAGANAECRPEMLTQFGIMGSIYMKKFLGIENPRVGLVNIGVEETKGTPLQLEAYEQMQKAPFNFIGNIEAREIPYGGCDVAVTDGFTGNVVLKLTEGLGSYLGKQVKAMFTSGPLAMLAALAVKKQISIFKSQMDYKEYGGAPLLGASKLVIKAHGSSDAKAFKNAIRQAVQCCNNDVVGQISSAIAELRAQEKAEAAE